MAISKKLRFEVFKRDKFTCQYCGAKAPDVVLHADHIEPASAGGPATLLNLITACQPCNSGKSDRRLADDSVVSKQRDQLAALQERQEQLQMMLDWQRSLVDIDGQSIDALAQLWGDVAAPTNVNEVGKKTLSKLLRKYGFESVAEAIRIAADQYLKVDENGNAVEQTAEFAFSKIKGICSIQAAMAEKPYLKDLFYARAILRNRSDRGEITIYNLHLVTNELEIAFSWGAEADVLKRIARSARSWSAWRNEMEDYVNELRATRGEE